jgi:hypothetical protein
VNRLRINAPALTLFLLAPAAGELLSGSAPPVDSLNPFGFVIVIGLYGRDRRARPRPHSFAPDEGESRSGLVDGT